MLENFNEIRFLQVFCAVWFLPHLFGKIRHFSKAQKTFADAGLTPPVVFIVGAIFLESLAMIGLGFGFMTQLAALCAAAVLLGAAYAMMRINGLNWRWQKMGPEYPLFWTTTCLVAGFAS